MPSTGGDGRDVNSCHLFLTCSRGKQNLEPQLHSQDDWQRRHDVLSHQDRWARWRRGARVRCAQCSIQNVLPFRTRSIDTGMNMDANSLAAINLTGLDTLERLYTLLVVLFTQPMVAWAHPLDEYLQVGYLTLEAGRITLELDMTPGVLVAPHVVKLIDADGDGKFSQVEGDAFAQRVLADVTAELDGVRVPLRVTDVQMPEPPAMQAGGGEMRLTMI